MKFIGGVLIVIGTCVGAGLLALPVVTSPGGFLSSVLVLTGTWLVMLIGAFYFIEITQWFPRGSNLVSIAKATMGPKGAALVWIIFLVLNYALLCAYISGASDIFHSLFGVLGIGISQSLVAVIFVAAMGYVVYGGIRSIDLFNRGLMIVKILAFIILIGLVIRHVEIPNLLTGDNRYLLSALAVVVVSFGFATSIPSILDYFDGNVKIVKQIIVWGTAIPLICYILWNFAIMGVIPISGANGLIHILNSGNTTTGLTRSLEVIIQSKLITDTARGFASVCLLTSFLGVSLVTTHFIADGMKFKKDKFLKFKVCFFTYFFPLLIVVFYPKLFIFALSYAGIFAVLILLIFPIIMVWQGRYSKKIAKNYRVCGGKVFVIITFFMGVFIFIVGVLDLLGWLPGQY